MSPCGTFLRSGQYFLSNALKGEDIGLEEVGDDVWNIVYYNTVIGRIDIQRGKITGSENEYRMCLDRSGITHNSHTRT